MAESKTRVILTALILCFVCSIFVSVAAVGLKPVQAKARQQDMRGNILKVAGLYEPGVNIDDAFKQVTPKVIDLQTGGLVKDVDPAKYDMFAAAKTKDMGEAIPSDQDIASIRRKPKYANAYFLYKDDGSVDKVIIPVNGYGLWSTMYAFIAVEGDGKTVYGVNFYQQAETPGLGGEVSNPLWAAKWHGKEIYSDNGQVALRLIKGGVDPNSPEADHEIDALSGASLTSGGVNHLLAYWLSDQGYKPFLDRLAQNEFKQGASVASAD